MQYPFLINLIANKYVITAYTCHKMCKINIIDTVLSVIVYHQNTKWKVCFFLNKTLQMLPLNILHSYKYNALLIHHKILQWQHIIKTSYNKIQIKNDYFKRNLQALSNENIKLSNLQPFYLCIPKLKKEGFYQSYPKIIYCRTKSENTQHTT